MLPYLIKRLLLIVPALWLTATAVFLLSRLLPGSFGYERILQNNSGYYSKGTEDDRQAAFRNYMRRTGQDQPLFYFSVAPAPHPQSAANNIYQQEAQEQLTRLTWYYGDANAAAIYYQNTLLLEKQLQAYPESKTKMYLHTLKQKKNYTQLQAAAKSALAVARHPKVKEAAKQVLEALEEMQQRQAAFRFLVPKLHWHGSHNQYHQWLAGLLRGDFGSSYRTSRPVLALLTETVGNTWWLLVFSMAITMVLALELSILMAQKKGENLRQYVLPLLFIADSIPLFLLALMLLVLLASPDFLQLFPVYGMGYHTSDQLSFWQQTAHWWQHMALPMLCLVLANLPYITNQVYTAIDTALQADYTRTAKAKGLGEGAVIRKHVLRNSLLPIITILSDFLPALVAGTFVIETIFSVPGIGWLMVESVLARDYPVLVGIVLMIAAFRLIAYLLADLGYALADPRIKRQLA